MGNNMAFTIFEKIVMDFYDSGDLNKELLSMILHSFNGVDVDSGGRKFLIGKDEKGIYEVVVDVFGRSQELLPKDDDIGKYDERLFIIFKDITKTFGWR